MSAHVVADDVPEKVGLQLGVEWSNVVHLAGVVFRIGKRTHLRLEVSAALVARAPFVCITS